MQKKIFVSDRKIIKLSKKIAKTFGIERGEALTLIYEEWDLVETLFQKHKKVKEVHTHLINEINYTYMIA